MNIWQLNKYKRFNYYYATKLRIHRILETIYVDSLLLFVLILYNPTELKIRKRKHIEGNKWHVCFNYVGDGLSAIDR